MIQANELRIGNWVEKFTDLGDSLGYSTVLPKEFLAIHTKPERVAPIPLTEEILLKCGCEISPLSIGIRYKYLYRLVWDDEFEYWDVLLGEYGNFLTRIRNVHEWQNFIHIMHGEELEVSLT